MADNTQLNVNSTIGDIIATDDIAGVKHQRVKVEYGPDGSATDVSYANPLPVTYQDPATGLVPGTKPVRNAGECENMAIYVNGYDLWRGRELTPTPLLSDHRTIPRPSPAGEQVTIVSESASDTAAGQGARTVDIHYIDSFGAEGSETVVLNGTTPVQLVASNVQHINDFHVATVGSNGACIGHLKIHKTGNNRMVYSMITAGANNSLVTNYMVPLGKTLVLRSWQASEFGGNRGVFRIRSTDMHGVIIPGVFCFKDIMALDRTNSGQLPLNLPVPALSIIKITAYMDQNGGKGSCSWQGDLIDDV